MRRCSNARTWSRRVGGSLTRSLKFGLRSTHATFRTTPRVRGDRTLRTNCLPRTVVPGRTQILMRKILIKSNLDELSEAAAGLFVAIAIESIAMRGKFSVALAGGSTPRALYSVLASDKYKKKVKWSQVTFFFGDE